MRARALVVGALVLALLVLAVVRGLHEDSRYSGSNSVRPEAGRDPARRRPARVPVGRARPRRHGRGRGVGVDRRRRRATAGGQAARRRQARARPRQGARRLPRRARLDADPGAAQDAHRRRGLRRAQRSRHRAALRPPGRRGQAQGRRQAGPGRAAPRLPAAGPGVVARARTDGRAPLRPGQDADRGAVAVLRRDRARRARRAALALYTVVREEEEAA